MPPRSDPPESDADAPLRPPHLVALLGDDRAATAALAAAGSHRAVRLHPLPCDRVAERLAALEPLGFAGAVVLPSGAAAEAIGAAGRRSLDADDAVAADTFTVTAGGLLADLSAGHALGAWLRGERWSAAGARAALIGEGPLVRAMARELASLGAAEIAVLGRDRPSAEKSLPALAASSVGAAHALDAPSAEARLRSADLVVRLRPEPLPEACYGPHLTLLDLAGDDEPGALPGLGRARARAIRSGATTADRDDFEAHRLAEALRRIVGAAFDPGVFLGALQRLRSAASAAGSGPVDGPA